LRQSQTRRPTLPRGVVESHTDPVRALVRSVVEKAPHRTPRDQRFREDAGIGAEGWPGQARDQEDPCETQQQKPTRRFHKPPQTCNPLRPDAREKRSRVHPKSENSDRRAFCWCSIWLIQALKVRECHRAHRASGRPCYSTPSLHIGRQLERSTLASESPIYTSAIGMVVGEQQASARGKTVCSGDS